MRARTFWFLTLPALILAETAAHTLVARLDPEEARHHVLANALEDFALPFVAVVGNDARWNAEYQIQLRRYGSDRLIGCDLRPLRYDAVTQALGGHGEHVSEAAALPAAIERAQASKLPACLDIAIEGLAAPSIRRGPQMTIA